MLILTFYNTSQRVSIIFDTVDNESLLWISGNEATRATSFEYRRNREIKRYIPGAHARIGITESLVAFVALVARMKRETSETSSEYRWNREIKRSISGAHARIGFYGHYRFTCLTRFMERWNDRN